MILRIYTKWSPCCQMQIYMLFNQIYGHGSNVGRYNRARVTTHQIQNLTCAPSFFSQYSLSANCISSTILDVETGMQQESKFLFRVFLSAMGKKDHMYTLHINCFTNLLPRVPIFWHLLVCVLISKCLLPSHN